MIILYISLCAAVFLTVLYFSLIAPTRRNDFMPPKNGYAHRGLWNDSRPENSLPAFAAAVEAGFGIETDVQLTKDGIPVVFHDYSIKRMCGVDRNVADCTYAELCEYRLLESDETIPTFAGFLETVGGKVPLLIELKGVTSDTALCDTILPMLDGYNGAFVVESFNPILLNRMKTLCSGIVRGQLVTATNRSGVPGNKFRNIALSAMLLNFLSRPDFVAYNKEYPHGLSLFCVTRLLGAGRCVWTVHDCESYKKYTAKHDCPIFDGFVPEKGVAKKMRNDYGTLKTERVNQNTLHIDKMSTLDMMKAINNEDKTVALAVETQLPQIAEAVDIIAEAIEKGGHLIYTGAGTSGRLGVVDASECPPTYGVENTLVRGLIAGGDGAMFRAVEGAEDSEDLGRKTLDGDGVTAGDVVVALSASGGAPFCIGALKRARGLGARTVAVTCNPDGVMNGLAEIAIVPYVGAEVIQGSTRMKAGTVQKLVLNMLSTGAMIKTGKVYGNLMINVAPTNAKLRERAIGIIMQISGCDYTLAAEKLDLQGEIRAALVDLNVKM